MKPNSPCSINHQRIRNVYKFQSQGRKSGIRGVAIYVNSELITKEVRLESQFRDEVWVEISLSNKDSLLCGCMYRSPTGDRNSAIESTKGVSKMILNSVLRGNSHLVICGDFNYPNIDWENEFIGENLPNIAPFKVATYTSMFFNQLDTEMEMILDYLTSF